MNISDELVGQLAHLARLEFNGAEKEAIQNDLEKILSFCEKLNEIDTDQIEPLVYMTDSLNVVRDDEVVQEFTREQLLSNAPAKDSDYFRVPKVISEKK